MTGRERKWGIAVRLLAAFALVFLSFAHRPALAEGISPAVAAEYVLPDGTFADVCFGADGVDLDTGHGKLSFAPVCEACRLAASVLLPVAPDESLPARNGNWAAGTPIIVTEAVLLPLRLVPPPRGPPAQS
ncbi:hypothetical protein GOC90_21785 [Sinorhizobium medicae]|nr:hypothetical protein [Sinorhizobium medicae]MDX0505215.1 hypothetical protein [Sinorhizobium medicae]MDX0591645.1 hypothetical protein [Sinorhizobium medicae]MDX0610088.1 hypothetical protein [Sinorhizobium medicae]MDX0646810.1 hypothetical protein [Sinorhizobium medicae]